MSLADKAVTELAKVFRLIEEEHRASGQTLPSDTTEIVHGYAVGGIHLMDVRAKLVTRPRVDPG